VAPSKRTTRYEKLVQDPDALEEFIEEATLGQTLGLLRFVTSETPPWVQAARAVTGVSEVLIQRLKNRIADEMLGRHRVVDHREHYTMLSYLGELGFEVVHLPTGRGDIASTRVSIERKEDDLVPSLFDDRRLRQLGAMREDAEFSYLIVTKSYGQIKAGLRKRTISERTFVSFIASLCAVGYPPIFIDDRYDASLLMSKIVDKIEDDNHRIYVPRPKAPTADEYRNAIIEGLPKVGPKTRRKLTQKFKTISELCQASVDDISSIEGIGKSTAEKIVEVLTGSLPTPVAPRRRSKSGK
jgi:DNA excision repair protein ERCC-4